MNYNPSTKKRYWKCVFYPESLPVDWKDQLDNTDLPYCISPLHDKDVNEDQDNTPKKAHYHIIIAYNNPTTWKNVKETICDPLNQPMPMPSDNVAKAYKYLSHEENPDKYQYDKNDIECRNGFNVHDFIALTTDEVRQAKKEIHKIIIEQNFTEYNDLCDYLLYFNDDLYEVATTHTIHFNALLKSKKYSHQETRIDPETGEVFEKKN